MNRGFEIVREDARKFKNKIQLPTRGSKDSAGYDFYSNENFIIKPGESHVFWTDVKAYMQPGEVLKVFVRSSIGIKKGLVLANGTGIIDCVPKGTLIRTTEGEIEVEKLMNDEKIIISYNELTGENEEDHLEDIWEVDYDELIEIQTENELIKIPENKQVYTKRGWIKAKELSINDEIFHY